MSREKKLSFEEYYSRIKRVYKIPDALDRFLTVQWKQVYDSMNDLFLASTHAQTLTTGMIKNQGSRTKVVTAGELADVIKFRKINIKNHESERAAQSN